VVDFADNMKILPNANADQRPAQPPRVESSSLFGNAREIVIVHGNEEYRLRQTSQGKLILTK
jgi:hemin uptake protein HemP